MNRVSDEQIRLLKKQTDWFVINIPQFKDFPLGESNPCDKKQKKCLGKPAPIEAPLVDRRSGSDEDDERQRRAESGKKLPKKNPSKSNTKMTIHASVNNIRIAPAVGPNPYIRFNSPRARGLACSGFLQ